MILYRAIIEPNVIMENGRGEHLNVGRYTVHSQVYRWIDYGKWTGRTPKCREIYCTFPGIEIDRLWKMNGENS